MEEAVKRCYFKLLNKHVMKNIAHRYHLVAYLLHVDLKGKVSMVVGIPPTLTTLTIQVMMVMMTIKAAVEMITTANLEEMPLAAPPALVIKAHNIQFSPAR